MRKNGSKDACIECSDSDLCSSQQSEPQQSQRSISLEEREDGLMAIALLSGSSGLGSSPGRGHCVVLLGKTLYYKSAALNPSV